MRTWTLTGLLLVSLLCCGCHRLPTEKVELGMSEGEVISLLGQPTEVVEKDVPIEELRLFSEDETLHNLWAGMPSEGGVRMRICRYRESRGVYFLVCIRIETKIVIATSLEGQFP